MSVKKFELSIFYAIDLSAVLNPQSKNDLLALRAQGGGLFDRLVKGIESAERNGTFHSMGDEGKIINSQVERSLALGGKRTFSQLFFEQYSPYWFREDRERSLSEIIGRASGDVVTAGDLEVELPSPLQPVCVYKGCELRLFRYGTLSIRFSFCNVSQQSDVYLPVDNFISIIKSLESQTYRAFQERISGLSSDWSSPQHPVSTATGLSFMKCDLPSMESDSAATVSGYRELLIDTLYSGGDSDTSAALPRSVDLLDKEEILGLLNLAVWYRQYSAEYVASWRTKSLGYKNSELYLCDGTSSLIIMPEYWTTLRLQNYMSYIFLLSELINSQLSYIYALASSLEAYILPKPVTKVDLEKETVEQAMLMRGLILQMEKAGDVDALVSHGFTRKYLQLTRSELNIPSRIDGIYRQMAAVDARLTLESEYKMQSRGLSIDNWAVRIAIAALLLTVACGFTQLIVQTIQTVFVVYQTTK